MKRLVVFLIVGPLLTAAALFLSAHHPRPPGSDWLFTIDLFLSISTASILVGLVDGHLARSLTVVPRFLLMAVVGAIVAWPLANALFFNGLASFLLRGLLFKDLTPALHAAFALSGAAYAGVCALLANDWIARR